MPVRNPNSLCYACLLFVFVAASSCNEQELDAVGEIYLDLPATRYNYQNFNDTSNAIGTLGRVLFYDRQLSINNTISCASCHKQSAAFSDDRQFSRGFEGRFTSRNSMPIQNLDVFGFVAFNQTKPLDHTTPHPNIDPLFSSFFGFSQHLFWDGRESNLAELVLQPVGNHIEMGITDVNALADRLAALPYYRSLFNDAFQSTEVTPDRISQAVSTFLSGIRTNNTRFDQHNLRSGQGQSPSLNALELEGMMLFTDKYDCNSCHQVMSPVGYVFAGTFANIGLDMVYTDNGLQNTTGDPAHAGMFKIPSLRNVAYTAPYMHDGRFKTLDEVMGHYSEGMANHPNLDAKLRDDNGQAKSMNISQHEKQAIIAFLYTLSDESVLSDPKFSNPFKTR